MKANPTSQAGERTQENDSFPIDIMVKSFGNWALGYGWVTVNIGGNDVTGLALYARHTGRNGEQKDPMRRVVANVKEATCWLLDTVKVPAKYSGRLMAAAMNAGDFGDICKNHPQIATAIPQPFHHPDGAVTYQSPEETRKLREYWDAKERLIAAAPDLLRIVKMLKEWKDLGAEQIYFGTLMPSEDADSTEDLEDAVNSALAKVKGK